jgi:hypothetical protein
MHECTGGCVFFCKKNVGVLKNLGVIAIEMRCGRCSSMLSSSVYRRTVHSHTRDMSQ